MPALQQRFIFLNTTPWQPHAASEAQVGKGTDYPAALSLAQVVEIYWRRQFFTLRVTIDHPDLGIHSLEATGVNRCNDGYQLITPTGGSVSGSTGVIDEIGLSVVGSFDLVPESRFFEHGTQYLHLAGAAAFEGSGAPDGHISINGPGDLIGEAFICGVPIPLYGTGNMQGSFIVDGDVWT